MSQIRINSIKVKNYRSFGQEQEFVFPNDDYNKPIAIVGYNNAGKTNLMNCILYGVGNKYIQTNTFTKNDLHNLDNNNHIKITIDLEGSEYSCQQYWDKDTKSNRTTKTISGVYNIFTEIDNSEIKSEMRPSMFGHNKNYNIFYINFHTIKEEISTRKTSWGNLTSFLAKHIKSIVDTDTLMLDKRESYENQVKLATYNVLENSQLSNFITKIKQNYSNNLRNNNCEVIFGLPDYEDIFLTMIFKVGLNGEREKLIPIDHFGDGYISMFVMAVIQAIAEQSKDDKCLFLFEEPESFLHENHQEYFYKTVLCQLAENGHQVIYTTHSDRMVDVFDTKSIIRIEFDEQYKQTTVKYNNVGEYSPTLQTNDEQPLTISNFNSYIKSVEPNLNKILFSRKVVLVEGPNDILAYKIAIEKEVERITADRRYSQTYLSFLNIAFIVHHGKSTAYLLIELCKHFGLDYFVINDWDLPYDFIDELQNFDNEDTLKTSTLYSSDGTGDRTSQSKAMITINWKLLKSAGIDKIHFNIPKLESVLGYNSDDKDSLGVFNAVNQFNEFDVNFLPQDLRVFLELNELLSPHDCNVPLNNEVEMDEL